jgi:hypothetical protein
MQKRIMPATKDWAAGAAIMKRLAGGRLARLVFAAAIVIAGLAWSPARADVVVQIDKSSQRMAVSVDGAMRYNWPVSTGRSGYGTPSGTFHPQLMARRRAQRATQYADRDFELVHDPEKWKPVFRKDHAQTKG